jgi:uncharacterized protein GlcG (DUF336 family)
MESKQMKEIVEQIISSASKLLPTFLANPIDKGISNGNVSMCIIDKNGQVFGIIWGEDKLKGRNTFQIAWRKASQVWITGIPTGKYEELVYSKKIDPSKFGILNPDFIGWEGGWLVNYGDEKFLAVAVSGMRGEKDTELVLQAVHATGGKIDTK